MNSLTNQSEFLEDVQLPETSFRIPQSGDQFVAVDTEQAIAHSLSEPLNFPPINEVIFEGDSVAIALQADLPRPVEILQAIVAQLPDPKWKVVASAQVVEKLQTVEGLDDHIVCHDKDDENALSMLGINEKSEPVYINGELFDADVVIPVGYPSTEAAAGHDCIYPYFSGVNDQTSFAELTPSKMAARVRLANNQLGTFWGIQVAFGPGEQVCATFAGELNSVFDATRKEVDRIWHVAIEEEAPLVIATIESEAYEKTWASIVDALNQAAKAAEPNAPIVVCSGIQKSPPAKIRKALTSVFEETKVNKDDQQLAEIVQEHPIFLYSKLGQAKTEELGFGFIANSTEFQRIVDKYPNGILLRDAHRCKVNQKWD